MFKREGRDNKGYSICELKTIFFRYKNMIVFRYDNTGHHKNLNLSTYPHHKHEGYDNNVIPSVTKDLATVLKEIESLVKY